jgi:hypothetical protein
MDDNVVGIQYYKQSVLFSAGDLPPGVPFVVTTMNGSMPGKGISFLDTNGDRRYFAISECMGGPYEGFGGTFVIIEFDGD